MIWFVKIDFLMNLPKDMTLFWRSVTDLRGQSKRTSNIMDDFSNDNDVSEWFARS